MPGPTRGQRWPVAVALVAVLVLAAGAGWLIRVWATAQNGAAAADPQASVFAVLLAAGVAAAGVLAWAVRRRGQASLPATAEQVDHAAATLAGLVREQWQEEARARALGDPEPMPVRWRLSDPTVMDHPRVITHGGPLSFAGSSARIGGLAEAFRALPRRRLVIIGPPGSGKTTLAVQLLLELLPPPGQPPDSPIPVLFSLAGWAPDSRPRVQDWLIAQLEQTYPALRAIAPDAAAALVARGRVLPVLDGLDEVSPVRRAGIVTALNASLDGDGGVILTSRRGEYRGAVADARDVLTGAAVIAPLALTGREAAAFLRTHLPPHPDTAWDAVLTALEEGRAGPLAEVTASPLGLWLVRTVYIDDRRPPGPLIDAGYSGAAALRTHLLDELIPAVVRSRPPLPRRRRDAPGAPLRPARRHRPEDLRRWLTTLAAQLAATGGRPRSSDWAWWELAGHVFPTRRSRLAVRVLVGLAFALVSGMLVGAVLGLPYGMVLRFPGVGLLTYGPGLAVGLLMFRLTASPQHADLRLANRVPGLLRQVAVGLAAGLAAGLGVVLVMWLVELLTQLVELLRGPVFWLAELLSELGLVLVVPVLAVGLAVGLSNVLVNLLDSRDVAQRSASPTRSYRGDRAHSMSTGLVSGLMSGLAAGPLVVGPLSGSSFGLLVGLVVALARFASAAWFAFGVAALKEAARRRLPAPWQVMAVLEDCHRLGLLRTVGPAYQFRHAELQNHLAPARRIGQPPRS
jgi:hypothetical protein